MESARRFGEFVLDLQRHTLHRGEHEIHLGERAFGVLSLLVENAGRVVSRHELIDTVWRDVIVSDDSLARAVSDLRTALGDDASHARFIRTAHRQGYVFVAPVTAVEDRGSTTDVEEPSGRRWVRSPIVPVALVVLIVAIALVFREVARDFDTDDTPTQPGLTTWRIRALGPLPFAATAIKPAFAKTSNLLSVVAPDPENDVHSLFLLRPDGGEPLQLTRGIEVRGPSPEFTADDSHIMFTVFSSDPDRGLVPDVWLTPVLGGKPSLLVRNASSASTSPDGHGLVYSAVTPEGTSIRVRQQDGSEREVAGRGFWPRWSPDGRWIAYTTSDPEGGDGTIHVVRPDGSEHRELTTLWAQVYGLCWTPDSARVIFASEQSGPTMLWSVEVESGKQQSITRGPGDCASPSMAPDGRKLVFDFSHRRWYLFLSTDPGAEARRVLIEPGMRAVGLSADGTRIAVALGAAGQSPAVSVIDLSTMERHTVSGMAAFAVAWMPGGEDLVVAAPAPDGISEWIWRVPVGGGLPVPVLKGNENWAGPSASPDGAMIAAVRRSATGDDLVLHHLESGENRILATGTVIAAPRWSPDGRVLAWSGSQRPEDASSGGVWVCPVEGGKPRRLTKDGAWPVWEAGGQSLLFARFIENEGIWRVPAVGGAPDLVRRLEDEMADLYPEGLDAGRNGTPLLLFLSKSTGELYVLEPPVS